jgi:predicted dehydrogenase
MVLAGAQAKRHILCEKPFAASVAEAREMVAAVREAGVGNAVNHEFRMIGARQAMRRMVNQGALGKTFDIRAHLDAGMLLNPNRGWSWWSDRKQVGGMLQAMTSHLIDFLMWTFGDIRSLSAQLDTFIRTRKAEDGTQHEVTSDDQNAALLRFENGASGLIYVSGVSHAQRSLIEVHGSDASLQIDNNVLRVAREPGKFEPVEAPPAGSSVQLMTDYLSHAARVFRGEQDENVASFEQGLRVQGVMDAMHASSDSGGKPMEPARI